MTTEQPEQVSDCCGAPIRLVGPTERGRTQWWQCTVCNEPCSGKPVTEEQGK